MDKTPEPEAQPVYPQQYQQPYPYYYPPPPPKTTGKTIIAIVVLVLIVATVVPTVLAMIMYGLVGGTTTHPVAVPTGTWASKDILSSSTVIVEFGKVSGDPRPTDLGIILVRNGTAEGSYFFMTNTDGALAFKAGSGYDIADVEYQDIADNQKVNAGDSLTFTALLPNSGYTLRMIWEPTGDQISVTTFSTPA